MRIRAIRADQEPAFLEACRREVCRAIGIAPDAGAVALLPAAAYFQLLDDGGRPIGMAEAAMLAEAYGSWAASPYAALPQPAPFEALCGIRSAWVEPGRRDGGWAFALLYLAAADVFRRRGARVATCSTALGRTDLRRLYRRMGAEPLGTIAPPGLPPAAAYAFDLARLLAHPLARTAIAALHPDAAREPRPSR